MPMPHRRIPRSFPGYCPETLDALVALVRRAGGTGIDREALEDDLLGEIYATGLAHDGSEEGFLWHEILADTPNPKALFAVYSKAAEAEDPLSPDALPRWPPDYVTGLEGLLLARWLAVWRRLGRPDRPSVRTLRWHALSPTDREEIRAMLRELAEEARSQVVRGRPKAGDLDTLLPAIAEIWLRHTGRQIDVHQLETCENSRVVQFFALALEDAADGSEVTHRALARRWEGRVRVERRHHAAMARDWAKTPAKDDS